MNVIKPEFTSQVMSNSTSGILPYQQALYDKIQAGGIKHGELMSFTAGRQTGKSMVIKIMKNRMYGTITTPAKFTILDQAPVDGATWYTVSCVNEVSTWLREQSKELQHSHVDNNRYFFVTKFDIHEKLYTMMALKWS